MVCMKFQSLKISVSNLFVHVEESLPLIELSQLDLLSPLKELRVRGKISIDVVTSQQRFPPSESTFEYFQNMKAIMKSSPKMEGLKVTFQEDARVAQSQFFVQDLETVAKIFQENIGEERYLTELKDIPRMLRRDRANAILQDPKRITRKELGQYLGLLEDIFNSILHQRMRTRSSFKFNGSDRVLIAMSKARRWLYMRPEYRAWIERHDRNGPHSRVPIYYEKYTWDDESYWYNKNNNKNHPSFPSLSSGKSKHAEVISSPSSSDITTTTTPSRTTTKIYRPHNANE